MEMSHEMYRGGRSPKDLLQGFAGKIGLSARAQLEVAAGATTFTVITETNSFVAMPVPIASNRARMRRGAYRKLAGARYRHSYLTGEEKNVTIEFLSVDRFSILLPTGERLKPVYVIARLGAPNPPSPPPPPPPKPPKDKP